MIVFVMRSLSEALPVIIIIVLVNSVLFIFESPENAESAFCLAYLEIFFF